MRERQRRHPESSWELGGGRVTPSWQVKASESHAYLSKSARQSKDDTFSLDKCETMTQGLTGATLRRFKRAAGRRLSTDGTERRTDTLFLYEDCDDWLCSRPDPQGRRPPAVDVRAGTENVPGLCRPRSVCFVSATSSPASLSPSSKEEITQRLPCRSLPLVNHPGSSNPSREKVSQTVWPRAPVWLWTSSWSIYALGQWIGRRFVLRLMLSTLN